jgi:hypothetical protein
MTSEGECALMLDHVHVTVQKSAVLVLDKDFARMMAGLRP